VTGWLILRLVSRVNGEHNYQHRQASRDDNYPGLRARVNDACPTPLVHAPAEGKGRERKGIWKGIIPL
jgi:hypothetical protein